MASGSAARRLPGIEGLRGVAAFSILVYHAWLYGAPGAGHAFGGPLSQLMASLRGGVTLFFVLSGFLLYRPWVKAAGGGPRPSVGDYLRNRALRIVPAYLVILLVVAVVLEPTLLSHPLQLGANAALVQNYVPAYIFGAGIVPAWSLCIEVSFYLALPLLGWLALRRGRPWLPVALMAIIGIVAKAIPVHGAVWGLTILTHADWFACGMAAACLYTSGVRLRGRSRVAAYLSVGALAVGSVLLYDAGVLSALSNQTPVAIACGLLLLLVVTAEDGPLLGILDARPAVLAGLISYSVFLWHDPLLVWGRGHGVTAGGVGGFLVNVALLAFVTAVLSTITYRLVEKPALALKRRRAPVALAPEPAVVAPAAEAAPGLMGVPQGGR